MRLFCWSQLPSLSRRCGGSNETLSVTCDYQFFVGGNCPHRNGAGVGADAGQARIIGDWIDVHSKPVAAPANAFANDRGVLTNTAGEYQCIETAECGRERSEFARNA